MKISDIMEEQFFNEFENELSLPEYIYTSVYVTNIHEIRTLGLTPDISSISWNDFVSGFVFLTEYSQYAGQIADISNKVDSDLKEYIFILKIKTNSLNINNIFIYNLSENPRENMYVYHGSISPSSITSIFSYY